MVHASVHCECQFLTGLLQKLVDLAKCPQCLAIFGIIEKEPDVLLARIDTADRIGGILIAHCLAIKRGRRAGHHTQDYKEPKKPHPSISRRTVSCANRRRVSSS